MNARPARAVRYQIAVAIFAVGGVISVGFIPGVGLLLLCAACLVGFSGLAVNWRIPRIPGTAIWIGLVLSVLGVLVLFSIDPISGAGLLAGGVAIAILAAVYQWFGAAHHG
jgi:hypothetical protein